MTSDTLFLNSATALMLGDAKAIVPSYNWVPLWTARVKGEIVANGHVDPTVPNDLIATINNLISGWFSFLLLISATLVGLSIFIEKLIHSNL